MTETFHTYTHRPLIYKIMQLPAVFLLIAFVIAPFNRGLNRPLLFVMIFCFSLGFVGFCINLFWLSMPSYIKDGELFFYEDKIVLNSTVFFLNELKLIKIDCHNYTGKPGRSRNDGTYNKITVSKKDGGSIEHRFVISSGKKWHNLGVIMKQWKQEGFKIISNGIDLI